VAVELLGTIVPRIGGTRIHLCMYSNGNGEWLSMCGHVFARSEYLRGWRPSNLEDVCPRCRAAWGRESGGLPVPLAHKPPSHHRNPNPPPLRNSPLVIYDEPLL